MNFKNLLSSTWLMPALLFVLSIFGLLSALIGDAAWDVLSWISLGIPLAIIAWSLLKSVKQLK